jgi:hypothetical protein
MPQSSSPSKKNLAQPSADLAVTNTKIGQDCPQRSFAIPGSVWGVCGTIQNETPGLKAVVSQIRMWPSPLPTSLSPKSKLTKFTHGEAFLSQAVSASHTGVAGIEN